MNNLDATHLPYSLTEAISGLHALRPYSLAEAIALREEFRTNYPHFNDIFTNPKETTMTTPINATNKFHRIAALFTTINAAANIHKLVDSADLTVGELTMDSNVDLSQALYFPALFQHGMLSDGEAKQLDRKLVLVVQELMKEKIENAIVALTDLGVEVEASLYAEYTADPTEL